MCQKYDLSQAMFEMREYVARNTVAHIGLDDILAKALAANDLKSPHWKSLGQQILTQRQAINDGMIPERLKDSKFQLLETLRIYEQEYFEILDHDGDLPRGEPIPKEKYLPTASKDSPEDITQHVRDFEPQNSWEAGLRDQYLAAADEVASTREAIEAEERIITEASERKRSARKEHSQACHKLNIARASFLAMESYNRGEEEKEEAAKCMMMETYS